MWCISNHRNKRKIPTVQPDYPHITSHPVESSALQQAAAAAAAAAVSYSATGTPPYNCNMLYNNYGHAAEYAPQQPFYHTNFENRYLENSLFQYRPYYPDYNAAATTWGCIYDTTSPASNCTTEYKPSYSINHQQHIVDKKPELKPTPDYLSHYTNGTSSTSESCQIPRQTVLMWAHQTGRQNSSSASSVIQPQYEKKYSSLLDPLKSLSGVISTVDPPPTISADSDTASAITAKSLYLQGYSGAEEVWAHTHPSHPHAHQWVLLQCLFCLFYLCPLKVIKG